MRYKILIWIVALSIISSTPLFSLSNELKELIKKRELQKVKMIQKISNPEILIHEKSTPVVSIPNDLKPESPSLETNYKLIDLKTAINLALKNNYSLHAKEDELKIANKSIGEALTYTKPRVTLVNSYIYVDKLPELKGITIGEQNSNITKVILKQALYTFGKAQSGLRLAKLNKKQKKVLFELEKQDLILNTIKAYLNLLKAGRAVGVAKEGTEVIQNFLKMVESQHKAGVVLKTDVLTTKVRMLETRQKLIEARNGRELALQQFCNFLVIPVDSKIEPVDLKVKKNELPDLKTAYDISLKRLPEILHMNSILDLLKEQINLEKKKRLPDMGLNAEWSSGNEFNDTHKSWNAVVVFSANLMDSGQTNLQIQKARLEYQKSQKMMSHLKQNVRFGINSSFLKIDEISRQLELSKEIINTSRQNVKQIRYQYESGITINTDVLDAELALVTAKFGLNRYSYDFLIARASLFRQMGQIEKFAKKLSNENKN